MKNPRGRIALSHISTSTTRHHCTTRSPRAARTLNTSISPLRRRSRVFTRTDCEHCELRDWNCLRSACLWLAGWLVAWTGSERRLRSVSPIPANCLQVGGWSRRMARGRGALPPPVGRAAGRVGAGWPCGWRRNVRGLKWSGERGLNPSRFLGKSSPFAYL